LRVDDARPHPSTLSEYIGVVGRRKWVVLQAVLLVPVAAVFLSLQQHKVFESSAQVLLSRQNLSTSLTGTPDPTLFINPDRVTQTQADLARVAPIARRVVEAVHAPGLTATGLLSSSSVTELSNADILVFTVKNADPALSRQLAAEYARQFTIYRRQLNTASLKRARAHVEARMAQLAREGRTGGALYNSLSSRDDLLATMVTLQTSSAYVVQKPTGSVQIQPKPTRNALIGIALGLVLGLGLAFLLEALDSRARGAEEISERLGGLPLLARLPTPTRKIRSTRQLAMVAAPDAPEAESFRILRTQLDLARLEHPARTIMVSSAVAQEGKSTTAANLAIALARAGRRVVLVDLDLYQPILAEFFSLGGPGVTDVVLGTADLSEALVPIQIASQLDGYRDRLHSNGNGPVRLIDGSLEVLPAGQIPPDPGDFMNTQALRDVLRRLEERADTVLIDTSPLLQAGDAMTLSTKVDGLLVVVRLNVVRHRMLAELARVLGRTPATKLGFVLTDVPLEPSYGYAYRRGYQLGDKTPAKQATR
jgi:Mrp family chromosome partitioning ATPase/capsular polysaccharide biosynthesis protein